MTTALPIHEHTDAIVAALKTNQVVIIAGETGSGKSTQLPQLCLNMGLAKNGLIGHTQPRRIAARALATRIAEELDSELGQHVGYQIRFNEILSEQTQIKLMTDGILLAEIAQDRLLKKYSVIIIDEAHERSLNIDFLLGYLKQLLPQRPELKLIITSATIEYQIFSDHFNNAPVITIPGRTYPVTIEYQTQVDSKEEQLNLPEAVSQAANTLWRKDHGDILVFLPSEKAIRDVQAHLEKQPWRDTDVLPLYGRLSSGAQQKIFQPGLQRRIILATNVAETSITVPRIHSVIDSGLARIGRYSYRTKVQQLPIEPISQASAKQRSGRCGRLGPGTCIRLYSEDDFTQREAYTLPEICRTNLAGVILKLHHLKLGHIADFPFITPPDQRYVNDGLRLLHELKALNAQDKLTRLGHQLARLPLDPRFGAMLAQAAHEHCLHEMIIIVAALSMQDPRERPAEYTAKADAAHAQFQDKHSDFVSLLNIWSSVNKQQQQSSGQALRRWAKKQFLHFQRLREWQSLVIQIKDLIKPFKWPVNAIADPINYEAIHKSILAGSLSLIAMQKEKREYQGARGLTLQIFPASPLSKRPPKWIVAAKLIYTSNTYAHCVAKIEPHWCESLALHLLKRDISEPYWQQKAERVGAFEKLSLYGLPIIAKRRIDFSRIDPPLAHEIFIRHALIYGESELHAPFLEQNRSLVEQVEDLEIKSRSHDILVHENTLLHFYQDKIPETICATATFKTWLKSCDAKTLAQLTFQTKDIMHRDASHINDQQFPAFLKINLMRLPLRYQFDLDSDTDGVTLTVPAAALNQVTEAPLSWLVPGMLVEKLTAMIRALPKPIRRNCVPAPNFAQACTERFRELELDPTVSLYAASAEALKQIAQVDIDVATWRAAPIAAHLVMNVEVIDDKGAVIAHSRSLSALKQRSANMAATPSDASTKNAPRFGKTGLTDWNFGPLPKTHIQHHHGIESITYPALKANGHTVDLVLCATEHEADQTTLAGQIVLFGLKNPTFLSALKQNLKSKANLSIQLSSCLNQKNILDTIWHKAIQQVFLPTRECIRTVEEFEQRLSDSHLLTAAHEQWLNYIATLAPQIHLIQKALKQKNIPLNLIGAYGDLHSQLEHLIYPDFLLSTDDTWLKRYPTYIKGMLVRLEKLQLDPRKDQAASNQLTPLWQQYLTAIKRHDIEPEQHEKLLTYRWHIEEYRISLFSQNLGTKMKVSEKRLNALWQAIF